MYLSIYNTSFLSKKIDDDQFKLSVKTWAGGGGNNKKLFKEAGISIILNHIINISRNNEILQL